MTNKPTAFGLSMGMNQQELDIAEVLEGGFCVLNSVPKPHSKFINYYVVISESYGLTKILAVNSEIETNRYGHTIQSEFEHLREKLAKKYGGGELSDFLMEDSIWEEPKDWMDALQKKERILQNTWERSEIYGIDSNLESVLLMATASDENPNLASLSLIYEFTSSALYQDELEGLEDECL